MKKIKNITPIAIIAPKIPPAKALTKEELQFSQIFSNTILLISF
ncbi:MAG: hypothetical protein ABH811_02090 [archaeon]